MLYAVGPGRAPSSEVAHWAMLGYRPDEFPGRAVFEALGRGQEVIAEHVFAYAALRPAERRDGRLVADRPPDPEREDEDGARELVDALRRARGRRPAFALEHVWRGEAMLRIVRRRRRPGHRHGRVLHATGIPCCGRSRSCRRPSATARAAEAWTRGR